MAEAAEVLPPVEEIFNPHSIDYMNDPVPQCLALAKRGRLVWYEPWQAWIMTRMADIMKCWKEEPLSSDFYDWEFAPPRPPEDQWSNFERAMIGHSLLADHTTTAWCAGWPHPHSPATWWTTSSARSSPM